MLHYVHMSKTILVTGVNGFVGHHLAHLLKETGHSVLGIGHDAEQSEKLSGILDTYISCDLTDTQSCAQNINLDNIDAIVHLAGLANVGMSFEKPLEFINSNTAMAVNLLELVQKSKRPIRSIVVSSGAVYDGNQPMPIAEDGVTTTGSPYSVSKLTTELVTKYYRSRGVDCVLARPFNHIGPDQGPGFLVPDLARKIKTAIERGESEIKVGNLATKRDYTDVRDVARAYMLFATSENSPEYDTYNICSGESHSGEEILKLLKSELGASDIKVTVDESLLRPNDIADIRGDNSKLSTEFNWSRTIQLEQTIHDFVKSLN